MADQDMSFVEEEKPHRFQLKWIFPVLFKPRKALAEIAEKNYAVWLAPLLLLMVTSLILVLVSAPIIKAATPAVTPPQGFEYYTPEQQQQFNEAVNVGVSSTVTTIFPLLGKWLGIWVGWFLFGSIFHLSLTLNGSRSSNRTALNIVAWSSVVYVVRDIVQILAVLVTHQVISKAGLSGFMADGLTGFPAYLSTLLSFVDIYLLWQIILLGIAAKIISGLKSAKAWLATLIAIVIFMALKALPGLIAAQLGTLSTGGMFF